MGKLGNNNVAMVASAPRTRIRSQWILFMVDTMEL